MGVKPYMGKKPYMGSKSWRRLVTLPGLPRNGVYALMRAIKLLGHPKEYFWKKAGLVS